MLRAKAAISTQPLPVHLLDGPTADLQELGQFPLAHPLPRLGICTPDEHRMTVHTAGWQINLALRARIGRNAFAVCTPGRGRLPNMIVNMNTG